MDGFADGDGHGRVEAEGFVADCVEEREGFDERAGWDVGCVRRRWEEGVDFFAEGGLVGWVFSQEVAEPGYCARGCFVAVEGVSRCRSKRGGGLAYPAARKVSI